MKQNKNNQILFVAATPAELQVLKAVYKKNKPKDIEACFLCCGIGMLESAITLSQALEKKSYDFLVNIGICACLSKDKKIIQIARSVQSETKKEICVPQFIQYAPRVSIICSENIYYSASQLGEELYADMESYAIEKVCQHFNIPRVIVKIPYDIPGEETRRFNYKEAKSYMQSVLEELDIFGPLWKYCRDTLSHHDWEKYTHIYHFSVSENIIFEKLFHAYMSLSAWKFEDFYQEHKNLKKEAFLKKLEQACQNSIHNL